MVGRSRAGLEMGARMRRKKRQADNVDDRIIVVAQALREKPSLPP